MHLQSKLLDVVQRGVVRPIGSDEEKPVDARVIAASNQPLPLLVTQNKFRSDLYHRLDVVRLILPPLRERMEDLSELLLFLAWRHRKLYQHIERIEPDLLQHLQSLVFPGNIRQLENAVQRMLFSKTQGSSLGLDDWSIVRERDSEEPADPLNDAALGLWKAIAVQRVPYAQAIWQAEKKLLQTAIQATGQTRKRLAEQLQTNERTLYHKMRPHLSLMRTAKSCSIGGEYGSTADSLAKY
jgi:DNA-binding NtrC family response regulator